jgi:rRNA pseudouridine-1189 N-methylase Emg1 (Nep1/Mra1 family)
MFSMKAHSKILVKDRIVVNGPSLSHAKLMDKALISLISCLRHSSLQSLDTDEPPHRATTPDILVPCLDTVVNSKISVALKKRVASILNGYPGAENSIAH